MNDDSVSSIAVAFAAVVLAGLIAGGCWAVPKYKVYSKRLSGQAQLQEAESNRRIKILEAEATKEASFHIAIADSIRALGVASANRIIGHSLRDNPEYLTWLKIEALKVGENERIYIPTEALLPITEAKK